MSINLKTHEWAQTQDFKSHYFPEITSTNDVAKWEFEKENYDFALYLADHQTKGRGRNQNSWQNMSRGEILLSTWCFRHKKPPQPIFPPLVGLALFESLKKLKPDLPLRLKAPNDIYLDEGKLAGLLIEVNQYKDHFNILIGLGLNVESAPKLEQKTSHLRPYKNFSDQEWTYFCTSLKESFEKALEAGSKKELNEKRQEQIKEALNAGQPENQKVLSVSSQCDLTTATGTISWQDL